VSWGSRDGSDYELQDYAMQTKSSIDPQKINPLEQGRADRFRVSKTENGIKNT